MHSKIFQITRTRVDKDNYLNEDTLMQGDDSFFDYCAEIDDEERQYHIDNLVNNILPKGMFEFVSTIPYDTMVVRHNGEKILSQTFEAGRKPLPPKACKNGLARSISSRNF